jgi:uncharacterized protein YndB with AHSA1/START domain
MSRANVVHATTVVERRFAMVPPPAVFQAWADAAKRAQWDLPGGDDWVLVELTQDFRVGGRESVRFGPRDDPRYWSAGEYLDIVPDTRIVSAGVMHSGTVRTSATLLTVEMRPDADGTHLVLTDQSVYFDAGEAPSHRRSGWGKVLERQAFFLHRDTPRR